MIYLWAASGAAIAVVLEVLYRQQGWLWWTAPLQVFIGYTIARLLTSSGNFLGAIALFSFAVFVARVTVAVAVFGEGTHPRTWAIGILLLTAALIGRYWK